MTPKRILLLSAYDARSHRYWHQQLQHKFPQHQFTILSLQDRFFSWRMGGNALSFTDRYHKQLQSDYDLLIATSMTDLATLRGLYPHLAQIPNLLYFHENQFAYPKNHQQQGLLEIQLRSIYSAMAADHIAFNSQFNRSSFLAGVSQFCRTMPDAIPKDLAASLERKSEVLPVPIADDCQPLANKQAHDMIEVVWNHRWEHDKGPETLLALMQLLSQNNMENQVIGFHILGQQFRNTPPALKHIKTHHHSLCLSLGFITDRRAYLKTLQQADVVLSTAHHDFQGIAMLEGTACGCAPLAPDRLVYPELYPSSHLYESSPNDPQQEAQAIVNWFTENQQLSQPELHCHWDKLHADYHSWINLT